MAFSTTSRLGGNPDPILQALYMAFRRPLGWEEIIIPYRKHCPWHFDDPSAGRKSLSHIANIAYGISTTPGRGGAPCRTPKTLSISFATAFQLGRNPHTIPQSISHGIFDDPYWDLLRPNEKLWTLMKPLEICWDKLKSIEIAWNLLRSIKIYGAPLKSIEKQLKFMVFYCNLLKSVDMYKNQLKSVEIHWALSNEKQLLKFIDIYWN